jgi:hypothetical protein
MFSCSPTSVALCIYSIVRFFGFGTHQFSMLKLCNNFVRSASFCHSTALYTQATALGPRIAEEVQDQARKEGLMKSLSPWRALQVATRQLGSCPLLPFRDLGAGGVQRLASFHTCSYRWDPSTGSSCS